MPIRHKSSHLSGEGSTAKPKFIQLYLTMKVKSKLHEAVHHSDR